MTATVRWWSTSFDLTISKVMPTTHRRNNYNSQFGTAQNFIHPATTAHSSDTAQSSVLLVVKPISSEQFQRRRVNDQSPSTFSTRDV